MKTWNVRLILCVCVALVGSVSRVAAQDGQGKYVTEATVRLIKLIDAGNKDGYQLTDNVFSIGGGWLKKDTKTWVALYTVELKEGQAYRFVAAGDADAKDVDLQVVHAESMKVVKEDADTSATAQVDYTPPLTGRYIVRIRLYDSADNLPCVCLAVVMRKK